MNERVTTYEQSLRLKQLGVSQNIEVGDYFYKGKSLCFAHNKEDDESIGFLEFESGSFQENEVYFIHEIDLIKAFDGTQIDQMLPHNIMKCGHSYWLNTVNAVGFAYSYNANYGEIGFKLIKAEGKTKIEAKTKLLINLLEKKLIEV